MWEALKMLGYLDCYHMMNTMIDPTDNDMWLDAIKGKFFGGKPFTKNEWDMLLGHCQVCKISNTFPSPKNSAHRKTHRLSATSLHVPLLKSSSPLIPTPKSS